jgi:hypothetical protein
VGECGADEGREADADDAAGDDDDEGQPPRDVRQRLDGRDERDGPEHGQDADSERWADPLWADEPCLLYHARD